MEKIINLSITALQSVMFFILSPFGVNFHTPEPAYQRLDLLAPHIEVRRYEERLAAEVALPRDATSDQQSELFKILAAYIFGSNDTQTSITMTAPVEMNSTRIAMTSPIAVNQDHDEYKMRFFLPPEMSLEHVPRPKDERIHIISIAPRTEVIILFSGRASENQLKARQEELLNQMKTHGLVVESAPMVYLYNPPWTLPFLRRNEISVVTSSYN